MKYTVITGASSGIGYETALAFAARGKNLVIVARRKAELEELKNAALTINPELDIKIKTTDLTVTENVYELYEGLKELELETWINNAGFGNFDLVGEQKLTKIESMLHLNIEALTILSSLFVRDYAEIEGTQLINISSRGGYNIISNAVTYCATKFYVSAFTEGLAQELITTGAKMRAKVLAPSATETEFAQRATDTDSFDYEKGMAKFHTSKEMAGFLLDLYDNEKIVGLVNGRDFTFELQDPQFTYVNSPRFIK
ncbi:SDR family NAD(P)-dependent oxidoreductase [Listeria booriae]|uniref:SDR family NAD(P)-dependent oxidoreductase n=1 Tax=Listeria booriae TaxID=1552123 RepID=A0A842B866_9LIST|nr:SDR family NAD(P)-dependent oxidoreductase [Listeria booriae]MBC1290763.1 SDR family NAD(P)-dependent oxidoreductase [Listeria booriae]MBC1503273.1 SDR family NAD(P)-dependent oxidoreductase [Listeria booriae]MBC1523850.1 SDR family NAD(P)-dependent oxidoreductase [Listeria booriae]MBC1530646.1 SDR family NAD(P)-dependent oxidoreductase [Listeria booriae]MBC1558855.1 SDR family NAD(P)-dependent oxidoreductase [Listeria booriae]